MTRRVLCDMVAQRESDREDARAEFDKMDKWHSAELQAAMAENAKLRELVQELYEDQCDESDCWKYRDRLSELGIEVDE
jgi:hypothetical protein